MINGKSICLFLMLSMTLWMSACGREGSSDTLENLQGTWLTACNPVSTIGVRDRLVISDDAVTETFTSYSDTTCNTEGAQIIVSYTIKIGSTKQTTEGSISTSGSEIDFTVSGISLTPKTATAASNYNSISYCGFTDWANGSTKSIIGISACGMKAAGSVNYQSFSISVDKTIASFAKFLSETNIYDAWYSSASTRPSMIFRIAYTKQ